MISFKGEIFEKEEKTILLKKEKEPDINIISIPLNVWADIMNHVHASSPLFAREWLKFN